MKKLLRFLVISSFVLPVLIPSTVYAFGGPVPAYGFQDRERYRDMSPDRGHYDAEQTYLRRFELNRGDRFGDPDDQGNNSNSQGNQPNTPGAGQNAPLDGGLSLLLAAGIGLGVKKAFGKKKATEQDNNDTE